MGMTNSKTLLLFAMASATMACAHTQAPASPMAEAPRPIAWRPYGAAAFADAAREDKLVLVDVGIEGCTACRWMYEETYKNPGVAKRLGEGFVTISVDADVQPDLGVRFEEWGW